MNYIQLSDKMILNKIPNADSKHLSLKKAQF